MFCDVTHPLTAKQTESILHSLGHLGSTLAHHIHLIVCVSRRQVTLVGLPLCCVVRQAGGHTVEVYTTGMLMDRSDFLCMYTTVNVIHHAVYLHVHTVEPHRASVLLFGPLNVY